MTKEEKKEYLSRYVELERAIERRLEEVARLHALAERVTPSLSALPRGGRGTDRIQETVERILQLSEEINSDIQYYLEIRREIVTVIGGVRESVLRLLLEYRYLDGCTWEQIAEKLCYSVMQINRLHTKALGQLAL